MIAMNCVLIIPMKHDSIIVHSWKNFDCEEKSCKKELQFVKLTLLKNLTQFGKLLTLKTLFFTTFRQIVRFITFIFINLNFSVYFFRTGFKQNEVPQEHIRVWMERSRLSYGIAREFAYQQVLTGG